MSWIVRRIKAIMLVSGIFTLGQLYAFVAPFGALRTLFGASLEGPVANMVVRNWGALIALIGAMIVYGAFHPPLRRFILATTAVSKVVFIGLVIAGGSQFLGHPIAIAALVDVVVVLLFTVYLVIGPRSAAT
ncbi:MAG TPA: hypothetical protein VN923_19565 [Thermoanaerobaculia bacterium]|nr:hypothetical protein [Thermoanaerobaculia bacterium]